MSKADAELGNIEAEQALLGALITSNELIGRLPENFGPEHFFEPLHGRIYERIHRRIQDGRDASPLTLRVFFEGDEAIQEVGGVRYLQVLTEFAISYSNAAEYAKDIYDRALRRMLVDVAGEIDGNARDGKAGRPAEDQIRDAEQMLYQLGERGRVETGFRSFGTLAKTSLDRIDEAIRTGGKSGLATGLADIDNLIGGLKDTDLIVIAGRTSMGKSALAVSMAYNIACRKMREADGQAGRVRRVAYYSLEMDAVQLTERILTAQSGLQSKDLYAGRISDDEHERLGEVVRDLEMLPLIVNDAGMLTIDQLCANARREKRRRDICAIFVDYLQLVDPSNLVRRENRVQQVGEVTRRLKALAKELEVPVVALAQLSRMVDTRSNRMPQLSDLRESGSIEQDADVVMLIHREYYYLQREKPQIEDREAFQEWNDRCERSFNTATVYVAKNRNGAVGQVELLFQEELAQFSNLAQDDVASSMDEFGR